MGFLVKLRKPSPNDDPQTLRHIDVGEIKSLAKIAVWLSKLASFNEMLEQFLDKKWITFGMGVDNSHQGLRRLSPAKGPDHLGDSILRKAAQTHPLDEMEPDQVVERLCQRPTSIDLAVPISRDDHHR